MIQAIHFSNLKKIFLSAGLICFLAVSGTVLMPTDSAAQPGPGSPPPDLPFKPQQTPIDGGLTLLAAAGGGYAIKKLRDKKK